MGKPCTKKYNYDKFWKKDHLRICRGRRKKRADACQFQATVDATYQEKVKGKEAEAGEKAGRIREMSQEIVQLQQQINSLQEEIRSSKEKLTDGTNSYSAESNRRQQEIRRDLDKINQYIH